MHLLYFYLTDPRLQSRVVDANEHILQVHEPGIWPRRSLFCLNHGAEAHEEDGTSNIFYNHELLSRLDLNMWAQRWVPERMATLWIFCGSTPTLHERVIFSEIATIAPGLPISTTQWRLGRTQAPKSFSFNTIFSDNNRACAIYGYATLGIRGNKSIKYLQKVGGPIPRINAKGQMRDASPSTPFYKLLSRLISRNQYANWSWLKRGGFNYIKLPNTSYVFWVYCEETCTKFAMYSIMKSHAALIRQHLDNDAFWR